MVLEQDRPEVTVRRRSASWEAEVVAGREATIALAEFGISIPMSAIYRTA
jgi:hypothetical protein